MIFQGDQWEIDSQFTRLQNFLLDFFRSDKIDKISLKGVDHVLVSTVSEGKVYVRGYMVQFKKSGTKVPNAQLVEMGPFLDLSVRRTNLGSDDMWKAACKKPKIVKPTKVKNITSNNFGDKIGQIHMKKQNLDRMGGRRSTALRSGKRNITDTSGSNFNEEDYDEPTTSNPAPKKQKTLSQRNPLADF
jgi:ribosome production factor 2